jgi:general secretion pathway protein K
MCNNPKRGSALLMVLWLSAGLAAVGLSIASTVRTETDRVATTAEGMRAAYLASGAIERAIAWIEWGPGYRRGQDAMFWDPNKRRYTMAFPSGVATLESIPESAKLNINSAGADDLYRVVFAVSGDDARSRQIAEGILDWRSPTSGPTPFDEFYSSLRPTFRARHASFQEIEELLLVRGMTPDLFYGNYIADSSGRLFARGGLRDCLSVWGSVGPFDVNVASPTLMQAMGASAESVATITGQRARAPIDSPAILAPLTGGNPRLGVSSASATYTLRVVARLRRPDGSLSDVVRSAAAVVRLFSRDAQDPRSPRHPGVTGMQVRVLRSYDDAWSQDLVPPQKDMPLPAGNAVTLLASGAGQASLPTTNSLVPLSAASSTEGAK